MTSTQWPMHMFSSSILRHADETGKGWTFEQNTRQGNDAALNLAAAKQGGQVFGVVARTIAMRTADFHTALNAIYDTKYMAPQYFVMAGGGAYEGAVMSIDRMGQHLLDTPSMQVLNASNFWKVQTNDDRNKPAADLRRPIADAVMTFLPQKAVSEDSVKYMMSTLPLRQDSSVYSCIWVPATGFVEVYLY